MPMSNRYTVGNSGPSKQQIVEAVQEALAPRLDRIDARLDRVEARLANVEADVKAIKRHFNIDAEVANIDTIRAAAQG